MDLLQFIKDLCSLIVPIIDCIKKWKFSWEESQQESFELLERKLTSAPFWHAKF